jgi:hypothetical protein
MALVMLRLQALQIRTASLRRIHAWRPLMRRHLLTARCPMSVRYCMPVKVDALR